MDQKNQFRVKLIDFLNFSNDFYKKYTICKKSTEYNTIIIFDNDLQVKKFIRLLDLACWFNVKNLFINSLT